MACRGIIFDMDGVVCDSEPLLAESATRFFNTKHQLRVEREDVSPFIGTGAENYLRGVAEMHHVPLSLPEDKHRLYEIYQSVIQNRLQPVAGVIEFINCATSNQKQIALASSADWVKVEANLREIGLPPETFDVVISGDQAERKKPDPQIFLLAAKQLDLSSEDCLVIEDSPAGVRAAKAAGAHCLGVTTSFSSAVLLEAGADWTAGHLANACEEAVTW